MWCISESMTATKRTRKQSQGVLIPVDLLAKAKKKAKSEDRSFSAYVRRLVEADLSNTKQK